MKLRKAGGRLALFNLNRSHQGLPLLTNLVTVFELYTDEEDAVSSYFPDRATRGYDVLSLVQHQALRKPLPLAIGPVLDPAPPRAA